MCCLITLQACLICCTNSYFCFFFLEINFQSLLILSLCLILFFQSGSQYIFLVFFVLLNFLFIFIFYGWVVVVFYVFSLSVKLTAVLLLLLYLVPVSLFSIQCLFFYTKVLPFHYPKWFYYIKRLKLVLLYS